MPSILIGSSGTGYFVSKKSAEKALDMPDHYVTDLQQKRRLLITQKGGRMDK